MEIEFDVKITTGILYDYMLQHTYSRLPGLMGSLVGVLMLFLFLANRQPLILIIALVILLYLLGISESMLDELTLPFVIDMATRFLFVYLVLLVFTGFVSFLIYYGRYQQAQKKMKMYAQYLKKISHIYQKEGEGAKGDYLS